MVAVMTTPITQADREAALDGYHSFFENVPNEAWERAMLAGKHDDDEVVQAFAAHRIEAERESANTLARLQRERDQAVEALRFGERSLAVAIYGLPEMLEANALMDEEQMIPALQTAVENMRATLASIGAKDAG